MKGFWMILQQNTRTVFKWLEGHCFIISLPKIPGPARYMEPSCLSLVLSITISHVCSHACTGQSCCGK